MKKPMIVTGLLSSFALIAGILFKYRHAAGASLLIVCGLLMAAFVFMPLLFTVWVGEKKRPIDKLALGMGILAWMSVAIGVLFRVQHWPGATFLFYTTPAILLLGYLPANYIAGISGADSKANTIAMSVLVIVGCGSFFTLTVTPQAARVADVRTTANYLRAEKMLQAEKKLADKQRMSDTSVVKSGSMGDQIYAACETLKSYIIERETGTKIIGDDFENKGILIPDNHSISIEDFQDNSNANAQFSELKRIVPQYNAQNAANRQVPQTSSLFDMSEYKGTSTKANVVLNDLVQIQMAVLQHERI